MRDRQRAAHLGVWLALAALLPAVLLAAALQRYAGSGGTATEDAPVRLSPPTAGGGSPR